MGSSAEDLLRHLPATLHGFDRSDHKWLAVYLRGAADRLYNATDSDYRQHAAHLKRAGIAVHELDPDEAAGTARSRKGRRR